MKVNDLRNMNCKIDTLDHFKEIITEAIEGEGYFFGSNEWIFEDFKEYDDPKSFRARIICLDRYYAIKIFDIFYSYKARGFSICYIPLPLEVLDELKKFDMEVK